MEKHRVTQVSSTTQTKGKLINMGMLIEIQICTRMKENQPSTCHLPASLPPYLVRPHAKAMLFLIS